MERARPHSCSAPDSAVPCVPASAPQPLFEAQGTVLLWDPEPSRLQRVSRQIIQDGIRLRRIEAVSALPNVKRTANCHLAVMALEDHFAYGGLSLDGILHLKRQGFSVICYGDGAQSWPLSLRCQLLVAGALSLLDSASAEFAHALKHILTHLLQTGAKEQAEVARIKGLMQNLGIVGESHAILAVFQTVLRVSPLSDLPILLTGETGTGKELLARAIYQLDVKRRKGPFVALNCSAISPGLAESELFGHRRGAFTGADRDRKGLIRSADGGVLFLDEIGELDEALQAKLLRVLQESRVLAVGDDREVPVSVRIIAATNRNLHVMVQQGKFRADLFHRLNTLAIQIPPLRDRPADVGPLVEYFLRKHRSLRARDLLSVDPDFIEALTQLDLPGNVRQLENLMRWVLVHKDQDVPLNLTDLPLEIWQQLAQQGKDPGAHFVSTEDTVQPPPTLGMQRQDLPAAMAELLDMQDWNLAQSLRYCERLLIEAALNKAQGNHSQTARLLGITPRSIYNKVRKYHLHP